LGYPPGTSAQQSRPGLIHGLAITVAFGCLSAPCFVMARCFAGDPAWRGWARYLTVTGLAVATGYLASAVLTGLDQPGMLTNAPGGLIQRAMVVTGFAWVILLAARLLRQQQPAARTATPAGSYRLRRYSAPASSHPPWPPWPGIGRSRRAGSGTPSDEAVHGLNHYDPRRTPGSFRGGTAATSPAAMVQSEGLGQTGRIGATCWNCRA
jgi:hypothetical protein